MSEICVKYQARNDEGKILPKHSTYSLRSFKTVEEAEKWIEEEGDGFLQGCLIDSKNMEGEVFAQDELLIVKINGFPVVEEEVLAYV